MLAEEQFPCILQSKIFVIYKSEFFHSLNSSVRRSFVAGTFYFILKLFF